MASFGCQAKMNTFDFFFGLNLWQRLFSHTDNLSRTLQQTKMSALSGKRVACLTKDVLQKMRNDTSFRSFHDVGLPKSKAILPWVDRCYQAELARQEKLKLALETNISCDRTSLLQANILWSYWLDDERYSYRPAVWPAKLWYVCKDGASLN